MNVTDQFRKAIIAYIFENTIDDKPDFTHQIKTTGNMTKRNMHWARCKQTMFNGPPFL